MHSNLHPKTDSCFVDSYLRFVSSPSRSCDKRPQLQRDARESLSILAPDTSLAHAQNSTESHIRGRCLERDGSVSEHEATRHPAWRAFTKSLENEPRTRVRLEKRAPARLEERTSEERKNEKKEK